MLLWAIASNTTREKLARGRVFEELQTYIGNKTQGNENKIIIGDFNCTLDQKDRDEGNKTNR